MGRKTKIQTALKETKLLECCVLNAFKSLCGDDKYTHPKAAAWGAFGNAQNKSLAVNPNTLTGQTYLAKGKELAAAAPWAGVCQTFACASASVIKAKYAELRSLELFSFGSSHDGHVYIVVDRPQDSNEADPGTWGKALVVDIWYALQKKTPGEFVFKANSDYFVWLKKYPAIKRVMLLH